jgi:hypothetical protein
VKKYYIELLLIVFGIIVAMNVLISQSGALESKGLSYLVETVGVPLDDVYIHCRYAENVLAGNGYCFNPGETVTADTSPLWVLLIAIGGLLTSHLEVVAVVLSALFYLTVIIGIYRLSLVLGVGRNWSILIALLTMLSGRMVWSAGSGMEVSLACVLVIAVLWSYFTGKIKLSAVLLAVGVATRPEILLLVGILFFDQFIRYLKKELSTAEFFVSVSVFLVCVTPVFLLPLLERGSLIYHSSEVQGAHVSLIPDLGYLWFASKILFATVLPPFVLAAISMYYFRKDRRYRIIGAFAFGLPILLAFVAPQYRHHGRYFFPVIPLIILLGMAFISACTNYRVVVRIICTILFGFAIVIFIRWIWIYKYAVTNIAGQHVAAAKWVEEHTTAQDILASHDVGAIGYFTKRPVIDLVGLVTPEIYPLMHDQKLVWQYARAQGANVFIIYNRLNPTFYEYAKDSLDLQASFHVEPLVSSADSVMSIYRVRQHATH